MQAPKCCNCLNRYSKFYPAYKLINCVHNLCKKCLITLDQCRECGMEIGMDEHQLSQYQLIKNFEENLSNKKKQQIKVIEQENRLIEDEEQQNYQEECLLHSKPADLICLEDNDIICCNCALFGEHKGHQVINSSGILNKMTNYIEECLGIYEEMKLFQKQFNNKIYTENYMHILNSQKEKNKNFIDGKFRKLISLIEIEHRKALMKLESIYKAKHECLKKSLNFDQINEKTNVWYSQIQQLGGMMENTENLQKLAKCIPYIDNSGKGQKILSDGEKIISQLTFMKQKADGFYIEEENVGILTKFDETLLNKVQIFCKFSSGKDQSSIKKVVDEDKELSGLRMENELNLKKVPSQINKGMIESQLLPCDIQSEKVYPSCISVKDQSQMKVSVFTEQNLLLQSVEQIPIYQQKGIPNITRNIFGQKITKNNNYINSQTHYQNKNIGNQLSNKQFRSEENQKNNIYINEEYEYNGQRIATQVHIENIPMLSISDIKPMTNVSSYPSSDQSRFLSRDKELQDIINFNMGSTGGNLNALQIGLQNQKKKKNGKLEQVAEKYKGIVDDLKNDRAETIDLTGADLGDANIFSLCPYIKKSKKLKVLKLIKNKLTDDCIPQLLVSLAESKVTSLNLSQNLLTDKTCEYLPDYSNSNIKTLTLTLNKINRRQAKSKVDHLAKRGFNVVL